MKLRTTHLCIAVAFVPTLAMAQAAQPAGRRADPKCATDNGGITLPQGFCASIFADSLAGPRHLTVAPNGDVFVSLQGSRRNDTPQPGGVMVLRDRDGDGVADERKQFGNFGSSEVALFDGYVYAENRSGVLRFKFPAGGMEPTAGPDTVIKGLPGTGSHPLKTFVIASNGSMYVNHGTASNACQQSDRAAGSPGMDPCPELEIRAGIWRFDARKLNQVQSDGEHFARGIRNAVAITLNPADGALYVMQHGRDQLSGNWPKYFTDSTSAEIPAEEMFRVERGNDFGWPYCYFDPIQKKKLLAPEYGGDSKEVGRCASMKSNVAFYPGHWAPNGLLFYTGSSFPAKYRSGVFIAFHGSWNRAPLPQAGFKVVYQPMRNGRGAGDYEIFADGFAKNLTAQRVGGPAAAGGQQRTPVGLAQGPDGALYITDDLGGRVWKVVYTGK